MLNLFPAAPEDTKDYDNRRCELESEGLSLTEIIT